MNKDTFNPSDINLQKYQKGSNLEKLPTLSPIKSENSSDDSIVIEDREMKHIGEEGILKKDTYLNHFTSPNGGMDSSALSLSSSTTATILQAYAARLSSDSDYAR